MKATVASSRGDILNYLVGLSFVVPYMEIGIVRDALSVQIGGTLIPASVVIMLSIGLVLLLAMASLRRKILVCQFGGMVALKAFLDFAVLLGGVRLDNLHALLSQYLWFTVPFYYALAIVCFIRTFALDARRVSEIGIAYFVCYLLVNILANFLTYGFGLFDSGTRSRLVSPGGGPVVLGYTITLMMGFTLLNRGGLHNLRVFLYMCILAVGSIFTGSRASVWPMVVLVLVYFMTNKRGKVQLTRCVLLLPAVLVLNPVTLLKQIVPRAMDLDFGARGITLLNGLKAFSKQPIIEKLFGVGLSGLFPYQSWLLYRYTLGFPHYNMFFFNGYIMLVQPHNSFLYLLLETGLVGLLLFLSLFVIGYHLIRTKTVSNRRLRCLVLFLIIFLNCFDAVFMIQPGSAGLWWLLYFLVIYDMNERRNKSVSTGGTVAEPDPDLAIPACKQMAR